VAGRRRRVIGIAQTTGRRLAPDISLRDANAHTRLATYLNDHLGGSATGLELARRSLSSNRGNGYGVMLEQITRQIEEDIGALQEVMRRLDVEPDRVKQAVGWTAEKLGRLKLNGQLLGYSPLSRLVELEGLLVGVTGKLALWQALRAALGGDPRLAGIDLEQLVERAKEQRRTLERLRRTAAADALT
jgi:hypothetical protein